MSFDISDNKLLKSYKKIWEKASSLMKIEFDNEPVYGDKYKNTKIRSYKDKMLHVIASKKYYPQTFLQACKYEVKKTKK